MTRIKKLCALVLAVMMVVTAGVISVNAAQSSDSDAVSADTCLLYTSPSPRDS